MKNLFTLAVFVVTLFATSAINLKKDTFEAKLETSLQNNVLVVNSLFVNNSPHDVNYSYRFKSTRTGKVGKSINSQAGRAAAKAGQTVKLSQSSLSFSDDDFIQLELEILDNQEVVATHYLKLPH